MYKIKFRGNFKVGGAIALKFLLRRCNLKYLWSYQDLDTEVN